MGPQHPSTHGVFRGIVELDGETVIRVIPVMGYLHRGIEKLAEARTYPQFIPYTDRLDYVGVHVQQSGVLRDDRKAGRDRSARTRRIHPGHGGGAEPYASHMLFIGATALDFGGATGMMYTFRDRELILDLLNLISGARLTYSYVRIGGVMSDITPEFSDLLQANFWRICRVCCRSTIF